MKFLSFDGEILSVPQSVTFWVKTYEIGENHFYSINMSPLEPLDENDDPVFNVIIRREYYDDKDKAGARMKEIYEHLTR